MRAPAWILRRLALMAAKIAQREPDVIIGTPEDPYLMRWFIIPRNPFFNLYLHNFMRSDDARALHDHPWANASLLLLGSYTEHTTAADGSHLRMLRHAADIVIRPRATYAHRIELTHGTCWTVFATGPNVREWGFHCPQGWVRWVNYVDPKNPGLPGPGCGEG